MLKVLCLIGVAGLVALGLLTVLRAPTYTTWKLAILAGEFGHWLAGLALAVACIALAHLL